MQHRVWQVPAFLSSEKFTCRTFWESGRYQKGLRPLRYRKARPAPAEIRGWGDIDDKKD